MEIENVKAEAIVEKNVSITTYDAIALGCASEFIHTLVKNHKAIETYNSLPYDAPERKKNACPESIDLRNKRNIDTLMNELTMLDKFISKIAIRPSDSNIFD